MTILKSELLFISLLHKNSIDHLLFTKPLSGSLGMLLYPPGIVRWARQTHGAFPGDVGKGGFSDFTPNAALSSVRKAGPGKLDSWPEAPGKGGSEPGPLPSPRPQASVLSPIPKQKGLSEGRRDLSLSDATARGWRRGKQKADQRGAWAGGTEAAFRSGEGRGEVGHGALAMWRGPTQGSPLPARGSSKAGA